MAQAAPKAASQGAPLLSVRDVSVHFGGIQALNAISFDVGPGQIVGLIGPNGAGKTTLFNCLSRLYTPNAGAIAFQGRSILGMQPHEIAAAGIGRTFQNLALFERMSVLDNVMIGCHGRTHAGFLGTALGLAGVAREEAVTLAAARELIAWLGLEAVMHQPAAGLSFGTLKRVELARALALAPRLLLLDEPMAGMNAEEKEDMARFVVEANEERGTTVVMIEHDMGVVMDLAHRVTVLDFGERIAEGPPDEVRKSQDVQRAYLGEHFGPLEGTGE